MADDAQFTINDVADLPLLLAMLLEHQLQNGGTVRMWLCERAPLTIDDCERRALGMGWFDCNGGSVQITRTGKAKCLVYEVGEHPLVSFPASLPLEVRRGRSARIAGIAQ